MAKLRYRDSASEKDKRSFSQYLAEDEELILVTGFGGAHLRSLFFTSIVWPGLIFFAIGAGIVYFLGFGVERAAIAGLILDIIFSAFKNILTNMANKYLLTSRRVIIKKGVFAVKVTTALFDKITHIEVDQSFIDRILYHHGTIIINTAGQNKDEMALKYIDNPIEYKNLLERLINREREQYGMRSGPVVTLEGEVV